MSTNNGCTVCEGGNQFILFDTNNANVPHAQTAEETPGTVVMSPVIKEETLTRQQLLDDRLYRFVVNLADAGMDGRDQLAPYAVAYQMELAPRMAHDEFNEKYGTNIPKSTFYKYMAPVFNGDKDLYMLFNEKRMFFYREKFEAIIAANCNIGMPTA